MSKTSFNCSRPSRRSSPRPLDSPARWRSWWTSLLQILDIPILIFNTVVSILMRTLMLPLFVASFIPHALVKGIAAAVGYALLGAFVQAEGLNSARSCCC